MVREPVLSLSSLDLGQVDKQSIVIVVTLSKNCNEQSASGANLLITSFVLIHLYIKLCGFYDCIHG